MTHDFSHYICVCDLCSSAVYLKCFLSCCCQVPFPELHGEFTEYVGRAQDAIIAMSNYRLHIKFKKSVVNVSISKWQVRFSVVASERKSFTWHKITAKWTTLSPLEAVSVCILWMDRARASTVVTRPFKAALHWQQCHVTLHHLSFYTRLLALASLWNLSLPWMQLAHRFLHNSQGPSFHPFSLC